MPQSELGWGMFKVQGLSKHIHVRSQSATQIYLTELKEIAKQSDKDFTDFLRALSHQ